MRTLTAPNLRFLPPRAAAFAALVVAALLATVVFGQDASAESPEGIRIGERLTYNVSFGRYPNVAYAEFFAASRGRLGDKDAIELKARLKTLDFFSAAFHMLDESRTTFASVETWLPLYSVRKQNVGGLPKETAVNFAAIASQNHDLLTILYKIRTSGGSGSLLLQEAEKVYTVTFQQGLNERVKTDAGEFDTTIINVQSEYLSDHNLKELRINLSSDEAKIPVLIRFKNGKGEFRAALASVQIIEPEVAATPTPAPQRTPRANPTPRQMATPSPYVDNEPLAPELAFALGETLTYRITAGGRPVGAFTLQAKERKRFQGADSLLLLGTITEAQPGLSGLSTGDYIRAQVDPETLAPQLVDIKFTGPLGAYNQTAKFDQKGSVTYGTNRVDSPVGTQSIVSLIYAIRSFNLRPSLNTSNPVNDTRVAVFWENRPHIFTLRPSAEDTITINDVKVPSQLITVSTGNPQLDGLRIRVWLSTDSRRVPLRFAVGAYQADLVLENRVSTP